MVHQRKSSSLRIVFVYLWHRISYLLLIVQSLIFTEKFSIFQTKVAWWWGRGHSRSPVAGILYLGPSNAKVPCYDRSHLTSTVGEKANANVRIWIFFSKKQQKHEFHHEKNKEDKLDVCSLCPISSIFACILTKLTQHTQDSDSCFSRF